MKRLSILIFTLVLSMNGNGQQADDIKIVHAGTLLAVPGEAPVNRQSIVIRSGRIDQIVDGYITPSDLGVDAEKINLRDKFVLPGLIDMHVHITSQLGPDSRNDALYVTTSMKALRGAHYAGTTLRAGFTTVRDLGAEPEAIFALRDAINQGLIDGPTIVAAGSAIAATGGHGDVDGYKAELLELWTPNSICDGPYDCRSAVRQAVKFGSDWVKITATGGVLSATGTGLGKQLTDDELVEIMNTAHSLGVKVAAHAHGTDGINAALRAGVDSIDHGTFLDEESIELFLETGAYLVPTLSPAIKIPESMEGNPFYTDDIKTKANAAGAAAMDNIRRAYLAGVNIAFGTDTGVTAHGLNADEFAYMVQLGMSEMEAIHAATMSAATLLSQSDVIGSIEVGKRADIIATDRSPLEDITELERVSTVIKAGKLIR
jgi:imidazolonepropionase-like amidohydrolase